MIVTKMPCTKMIILNFFDGPSSDESKSEDSSDNEDEDKRKLSHPSPKRKPEKRDSDWEDMTIEDMLMSNMIHDSIIYELIKVATKIKEACLHTEGHINAMLDSKGVQSNALDKQKVKDNFKKELKERTSNMNEFLSTCKEEGCDSTSSE